MVAIKPEVFLLGILKWSIDDDDNDVDNSDTISLTLANNLFWNLFVYINIYEYTYRALCC